jgi:hypothetical protein
MTDSRPSNRAMAEHDHEVQMEKFETMTRRELHPELAVTAAMHYCAEHRMAPPHWLSVAATKLLIRLLGQNQKQKRNGRSASPCARYIQDLIHQERWDVVRNTREKQILVGADVAALKRIPNAPRKMVLEREKLHQWAGKDWLHAFDCASMLLQNTAAKGGPDTIKKSYMEYQRNGRGRISSMRYYPFDRRLLNMLGIKIDFSGKGKKVTAFSNLTL